MRWFSFVLSLSVAFYVFFLARRTYRQSHDAGYYRGRNDELAVRVMMEAMYEAETEVEEAHAEFRQLVAQQIAKAGAKSPEEWPAWDGIDRIALHMPATLLDTFYPEELRPFPFTRRKRTHE
jgi:hypothetical protein